MMETRLPVWGDGPLGHFADARSSCVYIGNLNLVVKSEVRPVPLSDACLSGQKLSNRGWANQSEHAGFIDYCNVIR